VGFSLLADAAGWRVVDTIPGTPAANAGIRPGDVLTAIEEKSAIDWTRDAIEQWLDQHATLTVDVQSADGERTLDLPIESLVP
jgi:C-terminal processing protease CtpA/Prc